MILKIALRNIMKNKRRSIATILALSIGGLAMLLFGGFISSIFYGLQTGMIREQGHLHVYSKGYMDFGAVDPDAYVIEDYTKVIQSIKANEEISKYINIITPQIQFAGIAGNDTHDNSKIFIGRGVNVDDYDKMKDWNGFNVEYDSSVSGLAGLPADSVILGQGMARMMGLCGALNIPECIDPPAIEKEEQFNETADFSDLTGNIATVAKEKGSINLLTSSSGGMPNIISVVAKGYKAQPAKSVDDSYVLMGFETAKDFVNSGKPKATLLIIQLHNSDDMSVMKEKLQKMFDEISTREGNKGYEVRLFTEVEQSFTRVLSMFSFIFGVMSIFLGVLIAVTVGNTITLTIMERISEVGTLRALGYRRRFAMKMFVSESALMGVFGILLALVMAFVFGTIINSAGLQWTPPSSANPVTINLIIFSNIKLVAGVAFFIFALSVISAINPARRAVRMNIVKALHYA